MTTISSQITQMAAYTAQEKASGSDTLTGAADKMTSNDFMELMLKQLQYQDPLDPMDNSQFLAQQAQFSQLETTQDISEQMAASNAISQAFSLIGKQVALVNPDNNSQVITGRVDAVYVDGKNSALTVGGKNYSMSSLLYAYDPLESMPDTSAANPETANSGSGSGSGSST